MFNVQQGLIDNQLLNIAVNIFEKLVKVKDWHLSNVSIIFLKVEVKRDLILTLSNGDVFNSFMTEVPII